jgi:hypothetical protein
MKKLKVTPQNHVSHCLALRRMAYTWKVIFKISDNQSQLESDRCHCLQRVGHRLPEEEACTENSWFEVRFNIGERFQPQGEQMLVTLH